MEICKLCKTEFEKKKVNQLYCTDTCAKKMHNIRRRDSGYAREYERKRSKKVTIGLHIRDEHLMQPTYGSKQLWDGIGRWSLRSPECYECATTIYKHAGHGICARCYEAMRRQDRQFDPKYQEQKKKADSKHNRTSKARKLSKTWIDRVKSGEVEITPVISNLLNNL